MKVWIDLTNSPHVLVMRPVIADLRARGHEVQVTARDFAQTLGLCDRFGIEHVAIGHHRGGNLLDKARGLGERSLALTRWAKGRGFKLALGHGCDREVGADQSSTRRTNRSQPGTTWISSKHQVTRSRPRSSG